MKIFGVFELHINIALYNVISYHNNYTHSIQSLTSKLNDSYGAKQHIRVHLLQIILTRKVFFSVVFYLAHWLSKQTLSNIKIDTEERVLQWK